MKYLFKMGLGFGITSGTITTLGILVGLSSGTQSKLVTIGGILTIAIADAISDSLGLHFSKKFEHKDSDKKIWIATLTAFLSKFFIALSFFFPVLFFSLKKAVLISIIWGLAILSLFSYLMAKNNKIKPFPVMIKYIGAAILVIIISQLIGYWIRITFI